MPITRRTALTLGAAVAAGGVLSACDTATGSGPSTPTIPPGDPETDDPRPAEPVFFGQPPPGELYFGASVPHYRSLLEFESDLGARLALNRSYFDPTENGELVVRARTDLRMGRLPHVSIKPSGTWADVASGRRDSWLMSMVERLADDSHPVFLTLNHEPENDAGTLGMGPQDYVAMQRRVLRLASREAPNVTIVPVLAHWTFNPLRTDVTPEAWLVDEAAVFGLDVYNPWSLANGKPWHSLGSRVEEVRPWMGSKPLAIAEYGCRVDHLQPARTAEWLVDAVDYARTHNVVSMSYYNSSLNSPHGSWELTGLAERTFARLLKEPWVVRPE